ncbi:MAG: FtsX-like permease family protein [Myxococcota bacterium]
MLKLPYESFIGLRYLMAKRRASVVSIITIISVTGVALGVTALIVVLSVMGGFKKDLKQKILGTKAHIVVRAADDGPIDGAIEVADRVLEHEGVVGSSPFLESEVMISSAVGLSGVIMRGIVPDRIGQVSELPNEITKGKLEYLRDDTELMEEITSAREREHEALLERFRVEHDEIQQLRDEHRAQGGSGDPGRELDGIFEDLERSFDELKGIKGTKGDDGAPTAASTPPGGIFDDEPPELRALLEGAPPALGEASAEPVLPEPKEFGDNPLLEDGELPDFGEGDEVMPPMFGGGAKDGFEDEMPPIPGMDSNEEVRIPGLIIGPELAKSLQVDLGDEVNVVTPNGQLGPMGRLPSSRPFRIVGIFYSGMYEYDANFAYTSLEDAMDFVGLEGPTGIELKTQDVERAVGIAQSLQVELGSELEVFDWMQMNRSLFYALKLEKIAMFVVLTFIILVASFSIVAMLIMIVIEKGREIALLKALGASNGGIMRTFIFQGTVIGTVGAAIGCCLGLLICYLLETVGFPLNSDVYYISTLPVDLNPQEVGLVVVCAVAISTLATIYPSIQAARLNPVDGLRDE